MRRDLRPLRVSLVLIAVFVAAATAALAGRTATLRVELLGHTVLPDGIEIDGTPLGGLSGLAWDARSDRYYALTDDPSFRAPARFYTLEIDLRGGPLTPEKVRVLGVTTLTDRKGRPFEQGVIDGEGMALTPGGTLLISSEGNIDEGVPPSIREFDLAGRELRQFPIPDRFMPKKGKRGLRHNLAFEGLTVVPGGTFFMTASESSLVQDGPPADVGRGSWSRILQYQLAFAEPRSEFLYPLDPVPAAPPEADGFRVNGLVEILAFRADWLLALERSYVEGVGNGARLYEVSLAGASDTTKLKGVGRSKKKVYEPAEKTLVLDLSGLGIKLDNLEGMTFGPRLPQGKRTLVLVSDDNFSPGRQVTQVIVLGLVTEVSLRSEEKESEGEGE